MRDISVERYFEIAKQCIGGTAHSLDFGDDSVLLTCWRDEESAEIMCVLPHH